MPEKVNINLEKIQQTKSFEFKGLLKVSFVYVNGAIFQIAKLCLIKYLVLFDLPVLEGF